MLLLPDLAPKPLEQLTKEVDEEALLVQLEEKLKAQADAIRDHLRNATPLGVAPSTSAIEVPEVESEADDDDDDVDEEDDDDEAEAEDEGEAMAA